MVLPLSGTTAGALSAGALFRVCFSRFAAHGIGVVSLKQSDFVRLSSIFVCFWANISSASWNTLADQSNASELFRSAAVESNRLTCMSVFSKLVQRDCKSWMRKPGFPPKWLNF